MMKREISKQAALVQKKGTSKEISKHSVSSLNGVTQQNMKNKGEKKAVNELRMIKTPTFCGKRMITLLHAIESSEQWL